MRTVIVLLPAIFLPAIGLAESALCTDRKAVCGNSPQRQEPSADTVRKHVFPDEQALNKLTDIAEKLRKNRGLFGDMDAREEASKAYTSLISEIQSQVLAEAAKQGFTWSDIEAHFEKIKADSLARFGNSPGFQRAEGIDRLENVTIFDPGQMASASPSQLNSFFDLCGVDGLETGVAYDPMQNRVIMCPGYVLEQARLGGLKSMDFVVGHELGHTVKNFTRAPKSHVIDAYQPFFQCLQKHDEKEFGTIEQAKQGIDEVAIPTLTRCLERVQSEKPDATDEIFLIRTRLNYVKAYSQELEQIIRTNDLFGRSRDGVTSHFDELAADLAGAETVANSVAGSGQAEAERLVRDQLNLFCQTNSKEDEKFRADCGSLVPPGWEDGEHPKDSFRVASILRHPRVRAELGCSAPQPNDHPWCSLNGDGSGSGESAKLQDTETSR
jgi:hypothetical protein